jgi:glycosyltransferase involved in cell wall biosynthesis
MINLSIILTAFKEEKTIGEAIKQIISQLPNNSEILVIAPDEPTLSVAKKLS